MENEYRYIHFPLFLIKNLFSEKDLNNTVSDIIDVGIYNYSKQFDIDNLSAYSHVIYCYYRGGLTDKLQSNLQYMYDNGDLTLDDDFNGFKSDGSTFEPYELDELVQIALMNNILRDLCIEFYKMHLALKSLKLTGNIQSILSASKAVLGLQHIHEAQYGREPSVMLKTDLVFDYYKKSKSSGDIILFVAYAAIKSIIGKKEFAGTTKKMIVSRMIGAKSDKVLQDFLKDKTLKTIFDKYSKRYWFDKLINELRIRDFIRSKITLKFGFKSRMYLSCKLDSNQLSSKLAENWNRNKGNTKLKLLKAEEKSAIQLFKKLTTAP